MNVLLILKNFINDLSLDLESINTSYNTKHEKKIIFEYNKLSLKR